MPLSCAWNRAIRRHILGSLDHLTSCRGVATYRDFSACVSGTRRDGEGAPEKGSGALRRVVARGTRPGVLLLPFRPLSLPRVMRGCNRVRFARFPRLAVGRSALLSE